MKAGRCCVHGLHVCEKRADGVLHSYCLECDHEWIELPLNLPMMKPATETGPMTAYVEP